MALEREVSLQVALRDEINWTPGLPGWGAIPSTLGAFGHGIARVYVSTRWPILLGLFISAFSILVGSMLLSSRLTNGTGIEPWVSTALLTFGISIVYPLYLFATRLVRRKRWRLGSNTATPR